MFRLCQLPLTPKVGQFAANYPDVVIDLTTEDGGINLVGEDSTPASIWVSSAKHGAPAGRDRSAAGDFASHLTR